MTISTGVGLISGINFEELITSLTEVNRRPISLLQQKQAVLNTKSEAYGVVSAQLTTLRDQLEGMLSADDFTFRTATSSDTSVLDVTSSDTAAIGSYSVRVLQLAQAERIASQGFGSAETAIGSAGGEFKIQVGSGAARAYDLDATTTLGELRDMINDDADSDVTASLINDGSATNPYRLVLTAKDTGGDNFITTTATGTLLDFENSTIEAAYADAANTFDGTVTSGGAYTGSGTMNLVMKVTQGGDLSGGVGAAQFVVSTDGGMTFGTTTYAADSSRPFEIPGADGVTVSFGAGTTNMAVGDEFSIDVFDPVIAEASDAVISVDGIQIRRDSNTFTDVIDGVTFTANAVSTDAVTASVSGEPGLINAKVTQFQSAFNDVLTTINSLRAYDEESDTAQPLFGDSAVRTIQSTLKRMLTSPVDGADPEYNTLASLGMTLQSNGTIGYDAATMNDVLENNLDSLIKMFARAGDSTNSQIRFLDASDATKAQTYSVNITSGASRASVQGNQALQSAGLAQDENLTFTFDGKTFVVNLEAGDRIDAVVSKINSRFSDENVAIEASSQSGVLQIQTTGYGSAEEFSITSDRAGGTAAQLGIGTTQQDAQGADVVGTINGQAATGVGQTLTGVSGTAASGLELIITASGAASAQVTFSRGIADQMLDQLDTYLDSETGIINIRQEGIGDTVSSINDRIATIETRIERQAAILRRQFIAMETQMAKWQGVGDYVTNTLSQLNNYNSS